VTQKSCVVLAPGIMSGMERGVQRVVFDAIVAMVVCVLLAVESCGEVVLQYGSTESFGQVGVELFVSFGQRLVAAVQMLLKPRRWNAQFSYARSKVLFTQRTTNVKIAGKVQLPRHRKHQILQNAR
jgi:hypothetical protein